MSALKMTITSWGVVALDKKELKALMRAAGNDVARKTRAMISRKDGGGRQYSVGGRHYRASTPGAPPIQLSGKLRGSLKTYVYKEGDGFAVRERQFYSLFLEAGAKGGGNPGPKANARARAAGRRHRARNVYSARVLEPRPHLDVVMAQEEKTIQTRVRKAFDQGLTWKETK